VRRQGIRRGGRGGARFFGGAGIAGVVAAALAIATPAPAGATPRFTEIGREAGLADPTWGGGVDKDHILESTGTGAALVDLDGDGRLDIYLVNGWRLEEDPSGVIEQGRNRLYRNLGDGRFQDVTERSGADDDSWGCGVCAGDYDGDGRIDLYVTNFGPNRLYRNLGRGKFEDVSVLAGVNDPGWGAGAAFFDADSDGDLDLYVANYIDAGIDEVLTARRTTKWREKVDVMAGPFGMRGGKDRFYTNEGDGRFRAAEVEAGMEDVAEAYGLGVVAADLDRDGRVDVYVANDSNPNYLYQNRGEGTFLEIGGWSGAGFSGEGMGQAGMGVDVGDLDGDLLPEIVVTNFARDHSTLYQNVGEGFFEDVTLPWRLKGPTFPLLSWGCAFLDWDGDADLDLMIVNGHIYPQVDDAPELEESYAQPPVLLRHDGTEFTDVSAEAGLAAFPARGIATGDVDGDGDIDVLVTGMDVPPRLYRNDTPQAGHWLVVRVLDEAGAPALNARVDIEAGGRKQTREVRSGSTYQSQSSFDLHFGLGEATVVDRLNVRFADGRDSQRLGVATDQVLVIKPPASFGGNR